MTDEGDLPVAELVKGFDSSVALLVHSAGVEDGSLVATKARSLLKTVDNRGTGLFLRRASRHSPLQISNSLVGFFIKHELIATKGEKAKRGQIHLQDRKSLKEAKTRTRRSRTIRQDSSYSTTGSNAYTCAV